MNLEIQAGKMGWLSRKIIWSLCLPFNDREEIMSIATFSLDDLIVMNATA
jgi:hypothetical protein